MESWKFNPPAVIFNQHLLCVNYTGILCSSWVILSHGTNSMLWLKLFVKNWQQWQAASKGSSLQPHRVSLFLLPNGYGRSTQYPATAPYSLSFWNDEDYNIAEVNTGSRRQLLTRNWIDAFFFTKFWCDMWPTNTAQVSSLLPLVSRLWLTSRFPLTLPPQQTSVIVVLQIQLSTCLSFSTNKF